MKEIVITNPNGITLNTKKTLVDDDIKILLDQSLLNQGGSGELMLKLVATGTYNEEDEGFDLGKKLEEGKAYLIDYYSFSLGHHNTGVLYHASEKETCSCVVSCNTTSDGEDFCCLLYIRGMILIYSSPYGDIATTEYDYIKVYELATTSESISEPTSNIKVAEIEGVLRYEEGLVEFTSEHLNIDYDKNVRIEIYNGEGECITYYMLGILRRFDEDYNLNTYIIIDNSSMLNDYEAISMYEFYNCVKSVDRNPMFNLTFNSVDFEILENATYKMKVYYVETNELTHSFGAEY